MSFDKKPNLKSAYIEYFQGLKNKKYIELVGDLSSREIENDNSQFYLPHFGVYKKDSDSLIIVLNGSVKTSTGYYLEVGDPLQNDFRLVLHRFRNFKNT